MMQTPVAEYLNKRILFLLNHGTTRTGLAYPGLATRREHWVQREGEKYRPASSRKEEAYPTLEKLLESKIKVFDPHGSVVWTTGQALYALLAQAPSVPGDGRSTTRIANAVAHCSCV